MTAQEVKQRARRVMDIDTLETDEKIRKDRAIRFGALLKRLREERGWSLREVEEKVNGEISNPYLSQLERGERNVPRLEMVEKLAKVFDVPLQRFLDAVIFLVATSRRELSEKDELWEHFQQLSPRSRETVKGMIGVLEQQESMERNKK